MRHLLDICDFTVDELNELISTAEDIIKRPENYSDACKGKKLATLFFEPSTRTRLSFEAAMYELGGHVLGFSSATSSSTAKGESVGDTIRVTGYYADIIAMRHPMAGAPLAAIRKTSVPIINAGDGEHCHPTQTLADLLTIHREKGSFENLTIGLCGDLRYGRTVHSLIAAMTRYKGTKFVFISPKELKIPDYIKATTLKESGVPWRETTDITEAIPELDILYMTRVQGERFLDRAEYERLKDSYILSTDKLADAKKDLAILHPLPRVNEISVRVDDDPRACYFKQVENGKFIRMALILKLLAEKEMLQQLISSEAIVNKYKCRNPNCITSITNEIDHIFEPLDKENGTFCCVYCKKTEVSTLA